MGAQNQALKYPEHLPGMAAVCEQLWVARTLLPQSKQTFAAIIRH